MSNQDYEVFYKIYIDMQKVDHFITGIIFWTSSDTVKEPYVAIDTHMRKAFELLQQSFKSDNSNLGIPKLGNLNTVGLIWEDVVQNLQKLTPVIVELEAILRICAKFNFSAPESKAKIESEITDLLSRLNNFQKSHLKQKKNTKPTVYDVNRLTIIR